MFYFLGLSYEEREQASSQQFHVEVCHCKGGGSLSAKTRRLLSTLAYGANVGGENRLATLAAHHQKLQASSADQHLQKEQGNHAG
jgi:hypothetical protein